MSDAIPSALSAGATEPTPGDVRDAASLIAIAERVLRWPWLTVMFPSLIGVLGTLYFALFGSVVAESTFTLQADQLSSSSVAAMASRFGISLPAAASGPSVDFYSQLLQSSGLLAEVARSTFRFPIGDVNRDTLSGTMIQLFGIRGKTPNDTLSGAIELLRNRVSVSTDFRANLVTIRVKAPWPALAQQINRRMLDLVNRFNVESRQSQAGAERRFAEERRQQAQEELRQAEAALERFLETNRTYQSSPRLAFEGARLQRRIDLQQQVYSTLAQAYEQARIGEVRNTPIISVVSPPEIVTSRSRSPFRMGILAAGAAFVLAVGAVLMLDAIQNEQRLHRGRYRALAAHVRRALLLRKA